MATPRVTAQVTIARKTLAIAAAGAIALAGGCVITTAPGQSPHAEWAGDYARQQAAEKDADRQIALQVRRSFAQDPVLKSLSIAIFVNKGEVTLCADFPDQQTRARAYALAAEVSGVKGVDSDCGS